MSDDFIVPDFAEQNNKPRVNNRRTLHHGTQPMDTNSANNQGSLTQNNVGNFFQDNKMYIIIGAVALVIILVLIFWVMTRDKKDMSKRPLPGNQNMIPPGYNGPPHMPPNMQNTSRGLTPNGHNPNTMDQQSPSGQQNQQNQQNQQDQQLIPLKQMPQANLDSINKSSKKINESNVETADDNEVNKYMNIGANDDDPISSEEPVQNKDNVDTSDFSNLEQYESEGDD